MSSRGAWAPRVSRTSSLASGAPVNAAGGQHSHGLMLASRLSWLTDTLVLFCLAVVAVFGLVEVPEAAGLISGAFVLLTVSYFVYRWLSSRIGFVDFFSPLLRVCWFFFIPQFVIPIVLLLANQSTLLGTIGLLLSNPMKARTMAVWFAVAGLVFLCLGYLLPVGKPITLNVLDLPSRRLRLPAAVLMVLGVVGYMESLRTGVAGYQLVEQVSSQGALFSGLASAGDVGILLSFWCFLDNHRDWPLLALGVLMLVARAGLSGSRGALFSSLILLMGVYQYHHKGLSMRRLAMWIVAGALVLVLGMSFGSLFRMEKVRTVGRASSSGVADTLRISAIALQEMSKTPINDLATFTRDRIFERLDDLSSLAVIVSLHADLKSREVAVGIDGNILKDLVASFVPRFLWPGKPVIGNSEVIGNLYFNTSGNSPATTYMGDLYRNFGLVGIFIGMALLGVSLRLLYRWFIEGQKLQPLRCALFLVVSLTANYESLYSQFFPGLIQRLVMSAVVIGIVWILTPSKSMRRTARSLPLGTNQGGK